MFAHDFDIVERRLRIATDDRATDAYLARAFARLKAFGLSDAPCDDGAILWNGRTASVVYNGKELSVPHAPGDALDAGVRGAAAIVGETFRRLERHRALYAAGVASGTACVALAGPRGVGKSTLALELLRRGWESYGDEFMLLERETLRAGGFPLAFMIRAPSVALLQDDGLARLCRGDRIVADIAGVRTWFDVDLAERFGESAFAKPRRLTHIVMLARSENSRSTLERLPSAVASLELLRHLFIARLELTEMWQILDSLAEIPCYRLSFGAPGDAAGLVQSLCDEPAWHTTQAI